MLAARLQLAKAFKQPSLCSSLHQALHGKAPEAGAYGSLDSIRKEYEALKTRAGSLLKLVDPDAGALLPSDKAHELFQEAKFSREFLTKEEGVTDDEIKSFFQLARFVFECGNELDDKMNGFACSAFYLVYYRQLVGDDEADALPALWGKLLSEIMTESLDYAAEDLKALAEVIRRMKVPHEAQRVMHRANLMHAALFPCLGRGTDGLVYLTQLLLEERA